MTFDIQCISTNTIYRSKHTTYLEQRIEKWQLVCERILLINELLFCILPHLNVPPTYVFLLLTKNYGKI